MNEAVASDVKEDAKDPEFWLQYWPELSSDDLANVEFRIVKNDRKFERVVIHAWLVPAGRSDQCLEWLLSDKIPTRVVPLASILASGQTQPTVILQVGCEFSGLIYCSDSGYSFYPIALDELDYVLLSELDSIDQVTGEVWAEVAVRLGSQIRSSIRSLESDHGDVGSTIEVASLLVSPAQLIALFEGEMGQLYLRPWRTAHRGALDANHKIRSSWVDKQAKRRGLNIFPQGQRLAAYYRGWWAKRLALLLGAPATIAAAALWFLLVIPTQAKLTDIRAEVQRLEERMALLASTEPESASLDLTPRLSATRMPSQLPAPFWEYIDEALLRAGLVRLVEISDNRVLLSDPTQSALFWIQLADALIQSEWVVAAMPIGDGLQVELQ